MKVARLLAPRWGRAINELLLQDRRCQIHGPSKCSRCQALLSTDGDEIERLAVNLSEITNGLEPMATGEIDTSRCSHWCE